MSAFSRLQVVVRRVRSVLGVGAHLPQLRALYTHTYVCVYKYIGARSDFHTTRIRPLACSLLFLTRNASEKTSETERTKRQVPRSTGDSLCSVYFARNERYRDCGRAF